MGLFRHSLAALAALCITAGACYADDKVDNPEYKQWAKFKPGTSITMHTIKSQGGVGGPPEDITTTLLEITPEKIVVEIKNLKAGDPEKTDIPAKIDKADAPRPDPNLNATESTEVLVVSGIRIKCKVTNYVPKGSRMQSFIKTWTSDDVPGGMVKYQNGPNYRAVTAMTIK